MARDVVERLEPKAGEHQVELRVTGTPAKIMGAPLLVDELVANLVDNAIKYNKPGGSVHVWAGMMRDTPTLSVSDTGIGIAPEDRERVFERFYRVDKIHSKEIGGTGLGLSIVKHAAAIHGAEIKMESGLGRGTKITVAFS